MRSIWACKRNDTFAMCPLSLKKRVCWVERTHAQGLAATDRAWRGDEIRRRLEEEDPIDMPVNNRPLVAIARLVTRGVFQTSAWGSHGGNLRAPSYQPGEVKYFRINIIKLFPCSWKLFRLSGEEEKLGKSFFPSVTFYNNMTHNPATWAGLFLPSFLSSFTVFFHFFPPANMPFFIFHFS